MDNPPPGFTDVALLRRRGLLMVAGEEKADRLARVFTENGHPALEWLDARQTEQRAPILRPGWAAGAIYDADCWDIEVESLLQGYMRGARAAGAHVVTGAPLDSARRESESWIIGTGAGDFSAGVIVNAAGAWADAVAQLSGVPPLGLSPLRRTAILVDLPSHIDAAALPEICDIDDEFYMKPDAGRLMVSPADETPSAPCDAQPEEIDVATAAWHVEEKTTVPVTRIAHRWAGLRTFAPDRAPVVGFSGRQPGFFWLAGQGGFGIQTSPALGRLAACLIAGEPVPADFAAHGVSAEMVCPRRFDQG